MWRCQVERPKTGRTGNGDGTEPDGGKGWDELNLAELEAEAFLLGHWKNFDELEEALNLEELNAIIAAAREREQRSNRFHAAINGIDMDKQLAESNKERFERIEREARAQLSGLTPEELEFGELGMGIEVESE